MVSKFKRDSISCDLVHNGCNKTKVNTPMKNLKKFNSYILFPLLNIWLPFSFILAIIKCHPTYELVPWCNPPSELENFDAEMGYQELGFLCLPKRLIAEHICCYAVCYIKIKHNHVDSINTWEACHIPLLVHKSCTLHDQNKKWLRAQWRNTECVGGKKHQAGSEPRTASPGIVTSCLPGSPQKL